jgi:hypothetical protein
MKVLFCKESRIDSCTKAKEMQGADSFAQTNKKIPFLDSDPKWRKPPRRINHHHAWYVGALRDGSKKKQGAKAVNRCTWKR